MSQWTKEEQAEHRKIWIEALRSGKYKQTESYLHNQEGFCCLGVACDVSELGNWEPRAGGIYDLGSYFYVTNDGDAARSLPEPVKDWLGLSGALGGYEDGFNVFGYLTDLNDVKRLPFSEIADFIETEPKGLTV